MKKIILTILVVISNVTFADEQCYQWLDKFNLNSFFFNTSDPVVPYSPSPYTKISEGEIQRCLQLSEHPEWFYGNSGRVKEYYELHEESQLDRNLSFVATNFLGTIIHGDVSQNKLALQLNCFDVRQLLKYGPYENPVLSIEAQELIVDSLKDIPYVIDIHIHNFGYDEGNFLNPKCAAQNVAPCMDYFKFMAVRYASGMTNVLGSTHEARKRIHLYTGHFPKLRGIVLPIHQIYDQDGIPNWDATCDYLTNQSSILTANTFYNQNHDSELFSAVSIHPFDPEWKEKMREAQSRGIYLIKWMPPQGIFPDDPVMDPYYREMKSLGMTLIAHSGPEHGIPTNEKNQIWADSGNPLRFRRPLQLGVNVILAHSGHHDLIPDLDDPDHKEVLGCELFIRIARETHKKNLTGEWKGKVYGDLAAVTTHYGPDFITELLNVANEEGIRFIYGSDHPYSNLIRPQNDAYDVCAERGLLDEWKVEPLKEIRAWNPLFANYIFTKNLRLIQANGEILAFPEETYTGQFKDAPLHLTNSF